MICPNYSCSLSRSGNTYTYDISRVDSTTRSIFSGTVSKANTWYLPLYCRIYDANVGDLKIRFQILGVENTLLYESADYTKHPDVCLSSYYEIGEFYKNFNTNQSTETVQILRDVAGTSLTAYTEISSSKSPLLIGYLHDSTVYISFLLSILIFFEFTKLTIAFINSRRKNDNI